MTFDLAAGYFEKLELEKERYIFHENRGKVKLFPSAYQYAFSSDDDVISVETCFFAELFTALENMLIKFIAKRKRDKSADIFDF